MERPTKPSKSCYVCGSDTWWQRPDGGWLCGRCHPNPNPGPDPIPGEEVLPAPQPNEGKYSSEVLVLRDRVILGTKKLNDAWEQIKGMVHDSEEWKYQMERWHQGNEKLSLLCTELKLRGYEDCLYLDDQGKKTKKCLLPGDTIGCRVCPSSRKYWEEEFDKL
ncbi:unnamed protein product [marine sediment metagenome]|uniref:Uncharacterized protein n=2 Tax=marine sediment metagenome TaxID=412755 RepID=X1SUN7_9ZZZZ